MNPPSKSNEWWHSFYIDVLIDLFLVRPPGEELDATLHFLWDKLQLAPGQRVFDQCCGVGGLSIPLAQRGVEVVGVDCTEPYIHRAYLDSRGLRQACSFHEADAFTFVPSVPCHAAFNWHSSFGYTEDDLRNRQMLERVYEALVPGGRFVLDYPNIVDVLGNFKPSMVRRHPRPEGELVLLRESRLNLERGMLEQTWTYFLPDGQRIQRASALRLYLPHQLQQLLAEAGFEQVQFFGSIQGEALQANSPRCLVLARKPMT